MRHLRLLIVGLLVAAASVSSAQSTVGVWQNITPSAIPLGLAAGNNCDYGALAIALAPDGTLYLGTCQLGVYKSADQGATWLKVDTGRNAAVIDSGRQWTLAVDPVNPQVLYTNVGYGTANDPGSNGAWKSTDGGVDWQRIWPSADPTQAAIVQYNFVAQVSLDPTDHTHVFLSWHGTCAAPYTPVCYGESHDAGATWTIRNGDPRWVPSEAQTIYILDAQRWLFANHADGLWRSSDAGASWTLIDSQAAGHWPSTVYRSPVNGAYYIGSDNGLYRSLDFQAWTLLSVGYLVNGIVGDGTTLYAANAGALTPWVAPGTNVYMTSPEKDGTTWTSAPWALPLGPPNNTPMFTQGSGGGFAYDPIRHVVYSSNGTIGLWRVQTAAASASPPPPSSLVICQQVVRVNGALAYIDEPQAFCAGAHQ